MSCFYVSSHASQLKSEESVCVCTQHYNFIPFSTSLFDWESGCMQSCADYIYIFPLFRALSLVLVPVDKRDERPRTT